MYYVSTYIYNTLSVLVYFFVILITIRTALKSHYATVDTVTEKIFAFKFIVGKETFIKNESINHF